MRKNPTTKFRKPSIREDNQFKKSLIINMITVIANLATTTFVLFLTFQNDKVRELLKYENNKELLLLDHLTGLSSGLIEQSIERNIEVWKDIKKLEQNLIKKKETVDLINKKKEEKSKKLTELTKIEEDLESLRKKEKEVMKPIEAKLHKAVERIIKDESDKNILYRLSASSWTKKDFSSQVVKCLAKAKYVFLINGETTTCSEYLGHDTNKGVRPINANEYNFSELNDDLPKVKSVHTLITKKEYSHKKTKDLINKLTQEIEFLKKNSRIDLDENISNLIENYSNNISYISRKDSDDMTKTILNIFEENEAALALFEIEGKKEAIDTFERLKKYPFLGDIKINIMESSSNISKGIKSE